MMSMDSVGYSKYLLNTHVVFRGGGDTHEQFSIMEFSPNGAELSLNSVNSENLRNLLCHLCLCGLVVSSLSLTQEILGSNPTILIFDF